MYPCLMVLVRLTSALGNSDDTKFFHNGVDGYWMNDTGQLIIRNQPTIKTLRLKATMVLVALLNIFVQMALLVRLRCSTMGLRNCILLLQVLR